MSPVPCAAAEAASPTMKITTAATARTRAIEPPVREKAIEKVLERGSIANQPARSCCRLCRRKKRVRDPFFWKKGSRTSFLEHQLEAEAHRPLVGRTAVAVDRCRDLTEVHRVEIPAGTI